MTLTAAAQTAAGAIKAVRIQGEVFKLSANGQSAKLAEGALLVESDTVTTGEGASVVLVFMNGSSVKVGPKSRLAIEEFKMDPLAEEINVSKLTKEPSVSKTALNLAYGEIVGDVKHLSKDSTYNIKTPVGAAGIRGTTFRIVFRPTGDGKAFNFQLSTAEGLVEFTGTTQAGGGEKVAVPKDQEVTVTAEVDPVTNQIISIKISSPTPISAEATAQITAAVTDSIQQAQTSSTFTTTEQQQASTPPPPSNQGTPPPTTPETPPRVTNPDGQG